MEGSKSGGVLKNFMWKFGERSCAQLVTLLVSIILARLLSPESYGAIAIVSIFISFANIFITDGLTSALIQKKEITNVEFSTMFFANIIISIMLYLVLFLIAPLISKFYNMDILTPVLRILSLKILLSSVGAIQQAYVSRRMMFKKFFFATLIGTIVSAVIGVFMAMCGFGVWAIVAQYLTNSLIDNIILWITVKWRPDFTFSFSKLRELLKYGWRIMGANLVVNIYNQMRSIVIGKIYSPSDLAFYNRGKQFPSLIEANVNTTISSVLFPVLSREQENKENLKMLTRKSIKVGSYIIWPIMIGLAVLARPIIILVLTEKWVNSTIYLQIYCLIYGLMPIQSANMQAIKATGNSDMYMKIEMIKRIIGMVLLLIVMKVSVVAIVLSTLVTAILFSMINSYPNKYYLNYTYKEQLKDIFPSFLLAVIMGGVVHIIGLFFSSNLLKVIVGVMSGGLTYVLLSILSQNDNFYYLIKIAKRIFKKDRGDDIKL